MCCVSACSLSSLMAASWHRVIWGGLQQVRSSSGCKWSSNVIKWVSCCVRVKTDHLLCVKSYCQRLGAGDLFPLWGCALLFSFCHFDIIILKLANHLKLPVLPLSSSFGAGLLSYWMCKNGRFNPSDVLPPCTFAISLSVQMLLHCVLLFLCCFINLFTAHRRKWKTKILLSVLVKCFGAVVYCHSKRLSTIWHTLDHR